MRLQALLFTFCIGIFSPVLHAQTKTLYNYQDLSHSFYEKQKDSIKKAWVCPNKYSSKETQKKYKEIWDWRTEFLTDAMADDSYLYEAELFGYVQSITREILSANKDLIPATPFLLIDRSSSANAYAVGNNIIVVNVGLIAFANSREELALAIAHELSHNILRHTETAMEQRAEWLSSDEFKKSLNSVLDSKYERYTRLKKVLETYSFSRSKHQRYHESDADSLAIVLLKKSRIPFSADFFLRLDSSDNQYREPLKQPLKNYFTSYNLPFEDAWAQKRSKGLSTRNYNFTENTNLQDSLKTHPDCAERYANTRGLTDANSKLTIIPASIKEKANRVIVWNLYKNMSLTPCLYRILLQKDSGNADEWYDFMLHNIMSGLLYADKQLKRFNAIGVIPKEYVSKNYYELQTMLEQIPTAKLEECINVLQSAGFWKGTGGPEHAMKNFMRVLSSSPENSDKAYNSAAKEFIEGNSTSMYRDFVEIFGKK